MSGTYTYDSYVHFAGGMNSGFNPANLEPSQYAKGVNITCRDGRVSTRPSFTSMRLEFSSDWDRLRFQRGKFQGAALYRANDSNFLVTVISGIVFMVRADTGRVYNMSSMSYNLRQYVDRCHFLQVNNYMIVQDGTSRPLIIEGLGVRMSDHDLDEVPPGTAMAYGHGRLFVKVGPRAFRAGDIVKPNDASSLLRFTEHRQFALGGTLMVNQELGEIQALTFAANFDTSTGDGPLLAMCSNGVVSFRVDVNRDKWLNTIFSKTQVIGSGLVGPFALAHMNSDVLFWSAGGLRSFSVLKSEVTSARRQVNLSREMAESERQETDWLRFLSSMAAFDGRVLATTGAYLRKAEDSQGASVDDFGFQGLIAIDFDQMAGNALEGRYSTIVSFDGLWTGPGFSQIISSGRVLYAFVKSGSGVNGIVSMDETRTGYDDERPIDCRLVTRALPTKSMPDMQDAPFVPKLYDRLELWVDEVANKVPFKLWAAVDNRQLFTPLAEHVVTVDMLNWSSATLDVPITGIRQPYPALRFAMPEYACDPGSGKSLLSGYLFQFAVDWRGLASVSRILFRALDQSAMPPDVCSTDLALVSTDADHMLQSLDYVYSTSEETRRRLTNPDWDRSDEHPTYTSPELEERLEDDGGDDRVVYVDGDGNGDTGELVEQDDDGTVLPEPPYEPPPDDTWYVQPQLPAEIYLGCSFVMSLQGLGGETGFDPENIWVARVGTAVPGVWAGYYPSLELAAGGLVNVQSGWDGTLWSESVVVTEPNLCTQDISLFSILIGFNPSLWDTTVFKSDIATLKYPAFQPALPETVEDGDVFDATISALDEYGNVLPNYVLAGDGLTLTWEKRIEGDWVYASVVQADDSAVDITTGWTDGVWTQSVKFVEGDLEFAGEHLLFADKVRLTVATPCTEQSAEADCTSLTDAATGDSTPQPDYAYSYVVQFTLTYDNGEDPPESYDYTERLVVDEIDTYWYDISGGTSAFWGGWQHISLRVSDGAVLITAYKYEYNEWSGITAAGFMEGEPPPLTGERLDDIDIGDRGWELHLTNVVVYDY